MLKYHIDEVPIPKFHFVASNFFRSYSAKKCTLLTLPMQWYLRDGVKYFKAYLWMSIFRNSHLFRSFKRVIGIGGALFDPPTLFRLTSPTIFKICFPCRFEVSFP
uniref:Uncharacterized protein n=1 Tax=Cacopsylla melanoneura TaxID=428564 RepID=A0A8D8PQU5_9HEMI